MALRIRLTARATRDLEEIRAYLLERNPQGADNVRADIDRTIETLAEFPGIGRDSDLPDVRISGQSLRTKSGRWMQRNKSGWLPRSV